MKLQFATKLEVPQCVLTSQVGLKRQRLTWQMLTVPDDQSVQTESLGKNDDDKLNIVG